MGLVHPCCSSENSTLVDCVESIQPPTISPRPFEQTESVPLGKDIGDLGLRLYHLEKLVTEEDGSASRSPSKLAMLNSLGSSEARGVANADGSVSNRHKAFQERKRLKQEKRRLKALRRGTNSFRHDFLSNVPEVEADVQYRFSISVMGIASEVVIVTACSSEFAKQLENRVPMVCDTSTTNSIDPQHFFKQDSQRGEGSPQRRTVTIAGDSPRGEGSPQRRTLTKGETVHSASSELNTIEAEMDRQSEEPHYFSERSLQESHMDSHLDLQDSMGSLQSDSERSEDHEDQRLMTCTISRPVHPRCLCPVPYPWGRTNQQDKVKLAKLSFSPLTFAEAIPACGTRLEAFTTALVIALIVDPTENDPSFKDQLQSLTEALADMSYLRPHLRPARAVLLVQRRGTTIGWRPEESWEEDLEAFEKVHGVLWKFGPMGMEEGNGVYAAFAKIASQRIYEAQNHDDESMCDMWSDDDLHLEEGDPDWHDNEWGGAYKSERGALHSSGEDPAVKAQKNSLANVFESLRPRLGRW